MQKDIDGLQVIMKNMWEPNKDLKIKWKKAWRQNWEENIDSIVSISRDSKTSWNKINLSKGKNLLHTNFLKDSEGNKYQTDKETSNLMESTWKDVFKITEE